MWFGFCVRTLGEFGNETECTVCLVSQWQTRKLDVFVIELKPQLSSHNYRCAFETYCSKYNEPLQVKMKIKYIWNKALQVSE